jgi:hypothetical protein
MKGEQEKFNNIEVVCSPVPGGWFYSASHEAY